MSQNNGNRVSNKKLIRKNRIINLLRVEGAMSRFDISKASDYSPPVVAHIVNELIEEGVLMEIGKGKSIGGRRPILVQLVPESGYIIGIDLGKNETVGVLMDLSSKIIAEIIGPTTSDKHVLEPIERLKRTIDALIAHTPRIQGNLKGIGIAVPSLKEQDEGLVHFDQTPYRQIANELTEQHKAPVLIENDTRMMTLGEKWFGVGYKSTNFIAVHLGHVIGAGIVMNGEPFLGTHNHSGSIGHTKVQFPGEKCHCGGSGCLETVAAGWGIAQKGQIYARENENSILAKMAEQQIDNIDARLVADAARKGDKFCDKTYQEMAKYTGRVIASTINLLNPELVILGGKLSYASDIFYDELKEIVMKNVFPTLRNEFKLETSTLKEKAGPLGACAVVLQEVFQSTNQEVIHLI
jgi:predicted NBD/HSP70 family sugar kinase